MSAVDEKIKAQFVVDFANEIGQGPTIQLNLTAFQAWCLMEMLQLACALPGRGQARAFAETVARTLQADLATTPALALVAGWGWNVVGGSRGPHTPGGAT
jgi:hypothetical protein